MTISSNFKIKQMVASDFNGAEIIDVSAGRSYGRRFKLKIGEGESKEYILSDLYQRVRKLSKKENEFKNLKSLRSFLERLKEADANAEIAYKKREGWYRFRTWFHRLSNFGSHADKMNKCISKIEKIIKTDKYLDAIGTLLRDAVSKRNFEMVKELVSCSGDIDRADASGNTPLILALNIKQIKIAKILIDSKADVNKLNNAGYSPLSTAVLSKQLDLVKLLLRNGADCNLVSKKNSSPLMLAVGSGKKEIIEELLNQNGIEVGSALSYATLIGCDDIVKLILDCNLSEINHADLGGNSPLNIAALLGNEKMVKLLLQYPNIQVNHKNSKGDSALSYAATLSHKGIVKLLLESEKLDLKSLDESYGLAKRNGEKEISDLLKTVMHTEDLFLQKEKLKLEILANSTSLKGLGQVQWLDDTVSISLNLEGARPSCIFRKMSKATTDFSFHFSNLLDKSESKFLLELFETILLDSDDESLDRIEKGLPVHLNMGFVDHAVSGMLWGPYFLVCNKGASSRKVVEVFQYDPKKLNLEILKKFRAIRGEDDKAYEALVFEELPVLLDFKPQEKFEALLETLFSQLLNFQTVGNCQWASPETAVFCYFTLSTLLADANGQLNMDAIPSNISFDQLLHINNKFYTWLSFVQAYNLEGYIGTDVLRGVNADKMERNQQRRSGINLDYSVVVSAIKEIKANINKTFDKIKMMESLVQILAKAISITKNESLDDKHIQIAKRILDSIETITPEEMKAEFESI